MKHTEQHFQWFREFEATFRYNENHYSRNKIQFETLEMYCLEDEKITEYADALTECREMFEEEHNKNPEAVLTLNSFVENTFKYIAKINGVRPIVMKLKK